MIFEKMIHIFGEDDRWKSPANSNVLDRYSCVRTICLNMNKNQASFSYLCLSLKNY